MTDRWRDINHHCYSKIQDALCTQTPLQGRFRAFTRQAHDRQDEHEEVKQCGLNKWNEEDASLNV